MKKFIALFLAITLIVGATILCYAKETYGDIDKNGTVEIADAVSLPQSQLSFLISLPQVVIIDMV